MQLLCVINQVRVASLLGASANGRGKLINDAQRIALNQRAWEIASGVANDRKVRCLREDLHLCLFGRGSAHGVRSRLTTQAQRPGPRGRWLATETRWPGSLQ